MATLETWKLYSAKKTREKSEESLSLLQIKINCYASGYVYGCVHCKNEEMMEQVNNSWVVQKCKSCGELTNAKRWIGSPPFG